VEGKFRSNKSFLTSLAKAARSLSAEGVGSPSASHGTSSPTLAARLSVLFSEGKHDLIGWLSSRHAGLQQSMLHAPTEDEDMIYSHNKIFEPKPGATLKKGPNTISLLAKSRSMWHPELSVFNASSFGTYALLQNLRGNISKGRKGLRLPGAFPPLTRGIRRTHP
jgi:hypothetical protein